MCVAKHLSLCISCSECSETRRYLITIAFSLAFEYAVWKVKGNHELELSEGNIWSGCCEFFRQKHKLS
jgi:hypothetical protein